MQQAFPIYASALAEQMGINISFKDVETPYCTAPDGKGRKEVVLPKVPAFMEKRDVDKMIGITAHEVTHYTDTDFDVYQSIARRSKLEASLMNVFEDIFIEKLFQSRYRGGRLVLNRMASILVEDGYWEMPGSQNHPAQVLTAWLLARMRNDILKQPFGELADAWESEAEAIFPESIVSGLREIMADAASIASTQDAADLVERVVELLKQNQGDMGSPGPSDEANDSPDQQEQPSSPSGTSSNAGQQDEDSSSGESGSSGSTEDGGSDEQQMQGQDSGQSETSESDETGSGQTDPSQGEAPEKGASQKQSHSSASAEGRLSEADREMLEELLNATEEEIDYRGIEFKSAADELCAKSDSFNLACVNWVESPFSSQRRNDQLLKNARRHSNKLINQLRSLLQGRSQSSTRASYMGKRLHRNAFVYHATGTNAPCFVQKSSAQHQAAHVHLLMDFSGSMNGKPAKLALEAMAALALALDQARDVTLSAGLFSGFYIDSGYSTYARLKAVREPNSKLLERLEHTPPATTGGTPMAEGIMASLLDMPHHKDRKRIMFVCTDGQPNDSLAAEQAIQAAKDDGVKIIGIGIKSTSVEYLFDQHLVIQSVDDLSRNLFSIVGREVLAS